MKKEDLNLLPNYFNKIAGILILITIAFAGLHLSDAISVDEEIAKLILKDGILLVLLILALTKAKVEDELTINIRMQSFVAGFVFGVLIFVINPFTNLIFKGAFNSDYGSFELLLSMLFFYHVFYFIGKRNR